MPYRWIISQKISGKRKLIRDKIFCRAQSVIDHRLTEEKQLIDFPAVKDFLESKFPNVDLSSIKLYLTPSRVLEKAGFKDIGGCYVRDKKIILVKNEINHHYKAKGEFQKVMRNACNMKADVEDVVVHEFIHAVSDLIGRSLSKYRHMEEEFVYTNCVDFYHQKGMTDEDIVDNNFLPFCLQDIYESSKEMKSVFAQVNKTIDDIREMSEGEYQRFLNKNAEVIIPLIKKRAQEKAHKMIELYHKYGAQMYKTSSTEIIEDESAMRFSLLDLD